MLCMLSKEYWIFLPRKMSLLTVRKIVLIAWGFTYLKVNELIIFKKGIKNNHHLVIISIETVNSKNAQSVNFQNAIIVVKYLKL